ncbi:hypothetical protein PGT21_024104 [Puccinia graminis f. sp. tritici]|uniref:Snurportin-1 n=1 Tax=Puccinia graminis f. sp. tritici TaxID=56615 RepID=A0A5B0Q715_PUCGR|nr:hypothetical protein PGT21_024104 [Puccinia graminis f. sp. tritici]
MEERIQNRRTTFKVGLATDETAQEKRRREALAVQRARRSNTFDSIRGIEDLADCFLADADDDDGESEGKYDDAEDDNGVQNPLTLGHPSRDNRDLQSASASKPNKYRRFRDRCMRAEFLDLSLGLPAGFENDWILVGPVPKGKRCLALSLNEQTRSTHRGNMTTILLSRQNAHQIGEFDTNLPSGCILDCIYDLPNRTLWVLDVLKWKDQAMIDCEASFRFWWRDAKLSELNPQSWPTPSTLLCTSIPALSDFSKTRVAEIAEKMSSCSAATREISIRPNNGTSSKALHSINYESDGLLFYLKSATYESGESVLAGWVPLQVLEENSNLHGIAKLKWLCENGRHEEAEECQMQS